jgi:hypothetical protein
MKTFRGFKTSDLQQVVDRLKLELRFAITDAELLKAFAAVTLVKPGKEVRREVRDALEVERGKVMQQLCTQFSRKFEHPPRPRDLIVALEAAGYTFSRKFYGDLLKMLHEQNSERWTLAAASGKTKRLTLTDGEKAIWDALERTYNMNADAVGSMLLRLFTIVTSTGKVDYLEVPYLASSLTDKELKKHAESLNFTTRKSRKTRV